MRIGQTLKTRGRTRRVTLVTVILVTATLLIALPLCSVADTDVQTNNKQGREMTPLMDKLSCAKMARRIEKLDNKKKRREFIKECRAKREAELKAKKEAEEREKEKKKQEELTF